MTFQLMAVRRTRLPGMKTPPREACHTGTREFYLVRALGKGLDTSEARYQLSFAP